MQDWWDYATDHLRGLRPEDADRSVGRVRHHRRAGRTRGDRAVLYNARAAPHVARAMHRRGDPRWPGGDAGAGAGVASGGVARAEVQ